MLLLPVRVDLGAMAMNGYSTFSKSTIRLFNVNNRTLFGGLLLCRDSVNVFYSCSRVAYLSCTFLTFIASKIHTHTHVYIYIYIYIYILRERERDGSMHKGFKICRGRVTRKLVIRFRDAQINGGTDIILAKERSCGEKLQMCIKSCLVPQNYRPNDK